MRDFGPSLLQRSIIKCQTVTALASLPNHTLPRIFNDSESTSSHHLAAAPQAISDDRGEIWPSAPCVLTMLR